jgi:arsenate reductase (thioredoxin)
VTSSAGTRPSGEVTQLAIQVMKECGVDISNQKSKIITEDILRNADFLLTL